MNKPTGLILAGGRSQRFDGQDKSFVSLAGRPLIEHVIERLTPQVDEIIISCNDPGPDYQALGPPLIQDCLTGHLGPLAGIHAAMRYRPEALLAVVSVDLPFLPTNLVTSLIKYIDNKHCAYASNNGRHVLALLCPPGMAQLTQDYLQQGQRSIIGWLKLYGNPVPMTVADDSNLSLNINTPQDLQAAEKWYQEQIR